jgi:hypothetical protein
LVHSFSSHQPLTFSREPSNIGIQVSLVIPVIAR